MIDREVAEALATGQPWPTCEVVGCSFDQRTGYHTTYFKVFDTHLGFRWTVDSFGGPHFFDAEDGMVKCYPAVLDISPRYKLETPDA